MNTDLIQRHKVPLVVTLVGLLVAFGLGVAPSMKPDPSQQTVTAEQTAENQAQLLDLNERTSTMETSLANRLNAVEAQMAILNKAIGRNFGRVQSQKDSIPENLAGRLSNAENQISILNKASSRTFARVQALRKDSEKVMAAISETATHDIRILTLDKAVTRLNSKIVDLEQSLSETAN